MTSLLHKLGAFSDRVNRIYEAFVDDCVQGHIWKYSLWSEMTYTREELLKHRCTVPDLNPDNPGMVEISQGQLRKYKVCPIFDGKELIAVKVMGDFYFP